MSRISYLNGEFINHENAFVHIDDRAMQFADSVYEVTLFNHGQLIDNDWHLQRLANSLAKIGIKLYLSHDELTKSALELFRRNKIDVGSVYIQITRGVAPRNQLIPEHITPTVIMTVNKFQLPIGEVLHTAKVTLEDDIRWHMCDVKSTGLLVGSLLKQKAASSGFDDAILVRDRYITECTFANLFIVKNNVLITRPLDNFVLPGVTRRRIIELAKDLGVAVNKRLFSIDELLSADEVFSTSTTLLVRPIGMINDTVINDGSVGDVTHKMFAAYLNYIQA